MIAIKTEFISSIKFSSELRIHFDLISNLIIFKFIFNSLTSDLLVNLLLNSCSKAKLSIFWIIFQLL
jgi:hypothetical protein